MLKKKEFLGALLLISAATPSFGMQGFYAGLGFGPESADFRHKAHFVEASDSDVIETTHDSGTGRTGSLFIGYEKRFCACETGDEKLFLAGELNADISSVKYKESNEEFIHKNFGKAAYRARRTFGVSVLPGIAVTDCTVFYGRLGYVNRRIDITTTEITLPNKHKARDGFRYGFGIKQSLTDCFALRLDYSQSQFKKIKIFGVDAPAMVTKDTAISTETRKIEIGLIYNF